MLFTWLHRVLCTYPLLRSRPLMVSLLQRLTFEKRKSKQNAPAPASGPSPRLGVPSLRHCSGGPPPQAIHGLGRLARHPCRAAPCATPAFGLLKGQEDQKPDQEPKQSQARFTRCRRSRLAGELARKSCIALADACTMPALGFLKRQEDQKPEKTHARFTRLLNSMAFRAPAQFATESPPALRNPPG